jgi:hypothetical protein
MARSGKVQMIKVCLGDISSGPKQSDHAEREASGDSGSRRQERMALRTYDVVGVAAVVGGRSEELTFRPPERATFMQAFAYHRTLRGAKMSPIGLTPHLPPCSGAGRHETSDHSRVRLWTALPDFGFNTSPCPQCSQSI